MSVSVIRARGNLLSCVCLSYSRAHRSPLRTSNPTISRPNSIAGGGGAATPPGPRGNFLNQRAQSPRPGSLAAQGSTQQAPAAQQAPPPAAVSGTEPLRDRQMSIEPMAPLQLDTANASA